MFDFCFLRTTHCSNSEDKLTVKPVGYWALKTHLHYMKILCIRQNRFLVHSVSKMICGASVLWRSSRRAFSPSAVITHCLWDFWYIWKNKNENKINWLPFVWYILDLPEISVQCSGPDSSVSIATGYGLDGPGIESRWERDFPHLSRPALGPTVPPVQWVPCLYRV